jgi:hypothetical protein
MLIGGCQKKGDGLRGVRLPRPLIGFPETLSSASVSALGL